MEFDRTETGCASLTVTEVSVDGHECCCCFCCCCCCSDDYSSIVEFTKLFWLHFVVTLFLMRCSN